MLPLIAVTESLTIDAMTWLRTKARVIEATPITPQFVAASQQIQGLVVRTRTQVDQALLARLPNVKVVARAGVGLDNIDLAACAERGIVVVHTPDANTQAVVEYVLALLCDALRPRLFLRQPVDAIEWEHIRNEVCGARQMDALRLGIVGLGRVGSRVAQVAMAIGFEVVYHDLLQIPITRCHGATPIAARTLFETCDVISLHIDGRADNHHCIGEACIEQMKEDVLLLNTCRGSVLDHAALARFLRLHAGAQAVLDVHDPEPFTHSNPLLDLPNAHLAPHLASRTLSAMQRMSWVVRDAVAVLEGSIPQFPA